MRKRNEVSNNLSLNEWGVIFEKPKSVAREGERMKCSPCLVKEEITKTK